jgi:hypothetical protein
MIPITDPLLEDLDRQLGFSRSLQTIRLGRVATVIRRGGTGDFVSVAIETADGHRFRLSESGMQLLAKMTRLPLTFVRELPDALVIANVNHVLRNRLGAKIEAVLDEDDHITGWKRSLWPWLRPSDLLRTCRNEGFALERPPDRVNGAMEYYLTNPGMFRTFQASPTKNDVHHFSLRLIFDHLGWTIPEISAVGHRRICGNVMIAPLGVKRSWHVYAGTPETLVRQIRLRLGEGVSFIRTVLIPRIENMINSPLPDAEERLSRFVENAPAPVPELVLEAYRSENLGGTQYHAVNALTRAAAASECPRDWAARLARPAGELTAGDRCPQCFQPVRSGRASPGSRDLPSPPRGSA